jgi:hypothetical protein
MLIKNRKIWMFLWIVIIAIIMYGGFKDGWTALRIITGLLLLAAGVLNWLGWYVNEGILLRLDRMSDEQRTAFLNKLKQHERENLQKRLELFRSTR